MIHPCCPSDEDARRVFMSVLTFINKLKTARLRRHARARDDVRCPAGDAQYTGSSGSPRRPTSKQP